MSPSPETSCYLRMKRRKENPCSDGETKDEVITQRRSILSQKSLRYCNGMNKSFLPTVEKGALWAAGDLTDSWQLCFAHLITRHLQDFYNNILYFFSSWWQYDFISETMENNSIKQKNHSLISPITDNHCALLVYFLPVFFLCTCVCVCVTVIVPWCILFID